MNGGIWVADNPLKVCVLTLGCKVNQSESLALAAALKAGGARAAAGKEQEEADVYVINTCTVTNLADQKSRKIIRKVVREHPGAKVVVTGCYAQADRKTVESIPGVHLIANNADKPNLAEQILGLAPAVFSGQGIWAPETRTRAVLKIQDGCRQFCSYCIIPYVRGRIQSLDAESVCRNVRDLTEAGCREVVLTGIHLGAYGLDRGEDDGLGRLLETLLPRFPQTRVRLSSLEPTEVSPRILDLMRTRPNFCRHLHLPLQSGHDDILEAMNRPYTTAQFERIVHKVMEAAPDAAVTTDCIVGFPGETEAHFGRYVEFVEKMAFSRIHVFAFSPRKGTPAASMDRQISNEVKRRRSQALIQLGMNLSRGYGEKFIGETLRVLVEQRRAPGVWEGHASNYLMVQFGDSEGEERDYTGQFADVEILSWTGSGLAGKRIES
jgi:threonylcarbamoyladenosine tRNA methylthiotransferase MtaB